MKTIEIDYEDYEPDGSVFKRTAVRGIVHKEGKYLIVYSKYGDYCFPGGGREKGEELIETLIREVREETGYQVLTETVQEYAVIHEKRKGKIDDILLMDSYYFFCDVHSEQGEQDLDEYEMDFEYQVGWLSLDEVIRRNEMVENHEHTPWIVRENAIMRTILSQLG